MENTSGYYYYKHKERGALFPQILLTVTLCFGAIIFGQIFNWATAFSKHGYDLEFLNIVEDQFSWIACTGPFGICIGILVWSFLTRRFGPRRTLLVQAPFMMLSRILMGSFDIFQIYWTAHFLASFCAASYIYVGEIYLVDCLHRRNIKFFYIIFHSSVKLGILSLNGITLHCSRVWACIITGNLAMLYFSLIMTLPDSPQYLIANSVYEAENSIKYYLGKQSVSAELNIVRQNMNFLNYGSYSHTQMLSAKVVLKAIIIILILNFFRIFTGYHVFILDGLRIFKQTTTFSTSCYGDNLLYSVALFTFRLIGSFIHLYGNFGVKVPMMISLFLCSISLSTFGVIDFLTVETKFIPFPGTIFWIVIFFTLSYEIGMNLCIQKILYAYIPYQIYDFSCKLMHVVDWFLIFAFARAYMEYKEKFGQYFVLWLLSGISLIGSVFVFMFVIDIDGKSLMSIQMELGGNPIGNRGSNRQRRGNPFETEEDRHYLAKLITADLATATRAHS